MGGWPRRSNDENEQGARTPEQDVCVDGPSGDEQTWAPFNGARMRFRPIFRWSLVVASTLLVVLPNVSRAQAADAKTPMSPELQAAKAALARYTDPFVAIKDGYFSTVACMDFPDGAKDGSVDYPPRAMEIHFLNAANIGPNLDPTKPQVLIYAPVGDKLVLAAAEWFVAAQVAGGTT